MMLKNLPPDEQAIACKQLALSGTQDAVPELAALLSDEKLAAWARIALEAIPGPAADDALRRALGRLQGKLLVGVINSLGVRRDAKAIDLLAKRLKDADQEVASAAAVALGHIGGETAARNLKAFLPAAPPGLRNAVAEGCILCAEKYLSGQKRAQAIDLYDLVREAKVSRQRMIEATRGAILARQSEGVPILAQLLRSRETDFFRLGLRVARELPAREAADALKAELARATPARQALLILALADRGDSRP